jgi:hypothetical protein
MFKNALRTTAITSVVLILTAASAHASIVYNFVGTGAAINNPFAMFPPQPVSFQLTAPDFINPPFPIGFPPNPLSFVSFTCAQLDSSANCRPSGTTLIFSNQGTGAFTANLQFSAANNVNYVFFFPAGAFGIPGTYSSGSGPNIGTLTVTAVSEPSSIFLLLAGIPCYGISRLKRAPVPPPLR